MFDTCFVAPHLQAKIDWSLRFQMFFWKCLAFFKKSRPEISWYQNQRSLLGQWAKAMHIGELIKSHLVAEHVEWMAKMLGFCQWFGYLFCGWLSTCGWIWHPMNVYYTIWILWHAASKKAGVVIGSHINSQFWLKQDSMYRDWPDEVGPPESISFSMGLVRTILPEGP